MSASSVDPAIVARPEEPAADDPFAVTRAHFPAWAVPAGHLLLLGHCVRRLGTLFNPMAVSYTHLTLPTNREV